MIHRTRSLILGLSILGLTALPLQAGQSQDADRSQATCATESTPSLPVPTKVVRPGVTPEQVGKVVTLQFVVDENGRPQNVQPATAWVDDEVLVARMIRAVRSWEFQPAVDADGHAIAVVVQMPIVVEEMARG